jgi:hypothetical protein
VTKVDDGHPVVGVVLFDKMDPNTAAILFGVLSPIWWLFSFLTVYYPTKPDLTKIMTTAWVNPVDMIFFLGATGTWGFVLLCFGLSFIPSAAMRFIYFLSFMISNIWGPWLGHWGLIAVYFYLYLQDKTGVWDKAPYPSWHKFVHLFCLFGWTLLLLVFSIDLYTPLWTYYMLLADRAEILPYDRPQADADMEKYSERNASPIANRDEINREMDNF